MSKITRRETLYGLAALGATMTSAKSLAAGSTDSAERESLSLKPWIAEDKIVVDPNSGRTVPVNPATGRSFNPVELYGPCNGPVTFLLGDQDNATMNALLLAEDMPMGADYGVHYHKDWELIYVLEGQLYIEMSEYEGDDINVALNNNEERVFSYQQSATSSKVAGVPLKSVAQKDMIQISKGGWIILPGYSYHSVLPTQDGTKILAYLPDSARHDEKKQYNWKTCSSGGLDIKEQAAQLLKTTNRTK